MRLTGAGLAGAAVVLCLGMSACGGSRSSTSSTAVATAGATAPSSVVDQASTTATGHTRRGFTPQASSNASPGTCTDGRTSATIGGVHTCITAGQECSQEHAADYTRYGFACEQQGSTWVLRKAG